MEFCYLVVQIPGNIIHGAYTSLERARKALVNITDRNIEITLKQGNSDCIYPFWGVYHDDKVVKTILVGRVPVDRPLP